MIRNLKVLGLALAAVFAFAAVTASAASAASFLTSTGPVTLTGTQNEEGENGQFNNSLTAFGNKVICKGATYAGHKTAVTPHAFMASGESSTTITPDWESRTCTTIATGLEFPTTVDMNGCDFVFDLGETTTHETKTAYKVTVTEECPENGTIKVTVFGSAAKHTANEPFCVIDIHKQTDRGDIFAVDNGDGSINITGTVEHVVSNRTSPTGSILCGASEEANGIQHIKVHVTGHNEAGNPTSISLSHN